MESTVNDAVLLERWARERDAQAFRELVARHSAVVFAASRRILQRADQAEDVAQECFLELARAREPNRLLLPAWLHRVAVNRSLSRLRAEAGRRRTEANWARGRREPREPAWEEIEGLVDEAIARLPSKIGVPLVRHFLEGRS